MSFGDILKKSFLEGITGEVTVEDMLTVVGFTTVIALYIFCVYRVATRKNFYSKSFNISLVAVAVITAAIIVTIQSSAVISLGMVGALSIVRFRTAVKNPIDLVFLFWSISVGIICGAGLYQVAIITSVVLTLLILLLELLPVMQVTKILVLNAAGKVTDQQLTDCIKKHCRYYRVKSRSISQDDLEMILEVRVKNDSEMVRQLSALEGVRHVTLLMHDGEVTY